MRMSACIKRFRGERHVYRGGHADEDEFDRGVVEDVMEFAVGFTAE
jgi:hypothetical protein